MSIFVRYFLFVIISFSANCANAQLSVSYSKNIHVDSCLTLYINNTSKDTIYFLTQYYNSTSDSCFAYYIYYDSSSNMEILLSGDVMQNSPKKIFFLPNSIKKLTVEYDKIIAYDSAFVKMYISAMPISGNTAQEIKSALDYLTTEPSRKTVRYYKRMSKRKNFDPLHNVTLVERTERLYCKPAVD